eukprot:scaffold8369_cov121-Cylindrotheca_fusiformis.AAC.3
MNSKTTMSAAGLSFSRVSTYLLFATGLLIILPTTSFYVSKNLIKKRPLNVLPQEYIYDGSDPSGSNEDPNSFLRALCIVPQTRDWDRLQRARHYARDPVFHEWPPAIRLFHPFQGTAFDVAQVIEELALEPFEITFDTWVIVPNMEALQAEWDNAKAAPEIFEASEQSIPYDEEDRKVRELIEKEERKGREKYEARKMSGALTREIDEYQEASRKKSPAEVLEEQNRQYEESGGPSILCLEPDEESKQKLIDLRQAIAEILDHDTYSSPSSLYSWSIVKDFDMGYRPLIPVSSFDTLQAALDVARRLRGLWGDPLTFSVKELHLVSCQDDGGGEALLDSFIPQSTSQWSKEPWMCNAKIMLLGEEIQQDEALNEKMMQRLMEEGQPGGMDISNDFTILDNEEESISDIEAWLDLDDDWDEGTQVIIGRTHFYTGEQRTYQGMPASSSMDAKDRTSGEAGGAISGMARRKRTASRQRALCKYPSECYVWFLCRNTNRRPTQNRGRWRIWTPRCRLFTKEKASKEKERPTLVSKTCVLYLPQLPTIGHREKGGYGEYGRRDAESRVSHRKDGCD